jgi:hypothetical protein
VRYFIDTEFIESGPHRPIELISIGIVAEDGREYYAESSEVVLLEANDWVKANVIPHLGPMEDRRSLSQIAKEIAYFVSYEGSNKPEFWGYYADYDWVVFCQIFGSMINLPRGWPMYCRDIKQWADVLGDIKIPKQESTEHHALNDARWNKQAWGYLNMCPLKR